MPTLKRSLLPISIMFLVILFIAFSLALILEGEAGAAESQPVAATIHVDTTGDAGYADPMLLGTNLPAWLNSTRLANAEFRDLAYYSGVSLMRLPGGSWSNSMDWLACESEGTLGSGVCKSQDPDASWVAKPSDFIAFLSDTCQEAMYTVNQSGTSKEAAALVAFFNGSVDDETVIGIDVRGRNWGQVKDWAKLRSDNGSPNPLYVKYWEVGNETYGGRQDYGGKDCLSWGWERVWTCDGTEYVNGIGSSSNRKEGYLEFRNAMRAVDPSILVGAVGVPEQDGWSNWGNEVIAAAGNVMDFYIVHEYAYNSPPSSYADALAVPQATWQPMMQNIEAAFDQYASGRRVPIAITEYNMFAFQSGDSSDWMSKAVNGLFVADTIGQMMVNGFDIANQWDFAHGEGSDNPSYGMIQASSYERTSQYYVFPLWARFGKNLLPVTSSLPADSTLSVYASQVDSNIITLLAINKTGNPIAVDIWLDGGVTFNAGTADVVKATSLGSTSVTYNGKSNPADNLSDAPPAPIANVGYPTNYTFAPYSITLLRFSSSTEAVPFALQPTVYMPFVENPSQIQVCNR